MHTVYERDTQLQNEATLLGTLMQDPELMDDCQLQARHFTNAKHKAVYITMMTLKREGVIPDSTTLLQLEHSKVLQMGGPETIMQLEDSFITKQNFSFQQELLMKQYAVRRARERVEAFLRDTENHNSVEEITNAIRDLSELEAHSTSKAKTFKEQLTDRAIEHANSPSEGIAGVTTGYTHLDDMTDGWQRGNLHVVAARPSVGKTAFVLNSMRRAEKHNVFPTLWSLETPDGGIIDRMIAAESHVNLRKVKNVNRYLVQHAEQYERYTMALATMEAMHMSIEPDKKDLPSIRATIRQNMKDYPEKDHVLYVDYLTLITSPTPRSDRRDLEVGAIGNELKQIAKDFNIPVVALAQLKREVESRKDKRPVMSDLRESGDLEQIADMVSFLYRDDYQDQNSDVVSEIEFIIRKSRDGMTGTLPFRFNKAFQTYEEA